MKRTAIIVGVLAALAVPSVASAGNVTAQAKLQVRAQVVQTQIARTQVSSMQVVRARVVRAQVAKLHFASRHSVRPLGTKIVPLRTPR